MSTERSSLRTLVGALALLALPASAGGPDGAAPDLFGQAFSEPPSHLAELFESPPEASLATVRAHLEAYDTHAARWEAERLTEAKKWGRDRDAAWMALGMLHRDEGRHNLASAAFTRVRAGNGPLAELGTYYEAEQDLERGKYWVAARECDKYRDRYPDGRHFEDCHRLMAVAYAKAGSWKKARDVAEDYDRKHRRAPITEQIELMLTLGALDDKPERMVKRLQEHATEFTAPLTGRVAVEALDELRAQGIEEAVLPDDTWSRKARAYSLRNTKQTHAAWDAFSELVMESDEDRALARWVDKEAESFGWRTRNWGFLAQYYASQYPGVPAELKQPPADEETGERPAWKYEWTARLLQTAQDAEDRPARAPNAAETAWKLYRVLGRGGRYDKAVEVAETLGQRHKSSVHWRRKQEDVGRTYMLAGDYVGARAQFDAVARRGGWTGLRGRYYAAFAAVMAGDDDADALERLTKLVDADGTYSHESRYWRARVYDRLERPELARADLEGVLTAEPDSWYGALARQALLDDTEGLDLREGVWPGAPELEPPVLTGTPPPLFSADMPIGGPVASTARKGPAGFGLLTWSPAAAPPVPAAVDMVVSRDPTLPPRSYKPSVLFPRDRIERDYWKYAKKHKGAWPELETALDLARAGLYDLSGPMFSAIYEEWRKAYRYGGNKRHAAARAMKLDADGWRGLFSFVRDHHHTARFNHSLWEEIDDPELAREARRIGYPLAHEQYVWRHSRRAGIDPYLVLGLMRQESTYNSIARSPVGATGAMQIMPRTGHLMADLKHDVRFNAGDLEDPILSVGYGIAYLGLLMERFEGAYPLAIASYNGGPFNVSAWRSGAGADMPMDAFVEHIPFRETRDYVKKVSAGYSAYLSLYASENTFLAPPATPRGDHPEVVDF